MTAPIIYNMEDNTVKEDRNPKPIEKAYASPPVATSSGLPEGSSSSISEEFDMLNDPDFMERFEQSMDDVANGRTSKWKGIKRNV